MKAKFMFSCFGGEMNTVNIFKKRKDAYKYMISQIVFTLQAEYDDVIDILYDKDLCLVTNDVEELQEIVISYAKEKGYLTLKSNDAEVELVDGSTLRYKIDKILSSEDLEIDSISMAYFS